MVHLTFEGMEMQISAAWLYSNWPEMPVEKPYTSNIHSLSALFLFSAKNGFERLHKLGGKTPTADKDIIKRSRAATRWMGMDGKKSHGELNG